MANLSERQQHIIEFIIDFIQKKDFPPTIREIGKAVTISSTSVVNYNLSKLEELELISRQKEVSRGLSLNWPNLFKAGFSADTNGAGNTNGHSNGIANLLRVPILGFIVASDPVNIGDIRTWETAEEWVDLAAGMFGNATNLFALRVKGDSMIDASVLEGDIVVLRQSETIRDGDMVAAWIEGDDEMTLKKFYNQGNQIRLQPCSPDPQFQPIIRPADKVRVQGKVVSVIRHLL